MTTVSTNNYNYLLNHHSESEMLVIIFLNIDNVPVMCTYAH